MNLKIFIGALLNYLFNDVITHIPVHAFRRAFLCLANRRIHRSTKILLHTRLLHFWNLTTSENVVINQHCLLDCRRYPIHIGNNTDIGPYTRIWTLGHDPNSETHEVKGGPVTIGHHVWIASGITILPNVSIQDGAVVATGSVVTKSVEKLSIVAGNPAKEIRKRNNTLNYEINYNPIWE